MGALVFFAAMKSWPWGIIWRVALVVGVVALVYFFGRYLYALGASDERAVWESRVSALETKTGELAVNAAAEHGRRTHQISRQLATETEALQGVRHESAAVFLHAWSAADQRLRDAGSSGEASRA